MMRRAAWLLALACVEGTSCGGPAGAPQTCVLPDVSYKGTAAGPAFLKISGDLGLSMNYGAVSVGFLVANVNTRAFCYRTSDSSIETVTARAWVDVSGRAASDCVDVSSPACEPSPGDPQGHQHGPLRWGEFNVVAVPIADP